MASAVPASKLASPTSLPQAFCAEGAADHLKLETRNSKPAKGSALCRFAHPDGRPCASPAWKRSPAGLCYQHQRGLLETRNSKLETARRAQARFELALAETRRAHRSAADRADYVLRPLANCPNLDSEENIALVGYLFDRAVDLSAIDLRRHRVLDSLLRIARMNLKGLRRDLAEVGLLHLTDAAYRPDDLHDEHGGTVGELAFRPAFSASMNGALAPVKQTPESSSPLNKSRGSLGMTREKDALHAGLKPGSPTEHPEDSQ